MIYPVDCALGAGSQAVTVEPINVVERFVRNMTFLLALAPSDASDLEAVHSSPLMAVETAHDL